MDVCSDCEAPNPKWIVLNRGLIVCDDCSTAHRSLGRHISVIKSLHLSQWNPTQLEMAKTLINHGANSIWEFSLGDSNSKTAKCKFYGRDLHPAKSEFLHAKHQMATFVSRPSTNDLVCVDSELGKQLHATVRTDNLEASLKLLIQGADPNYFHNEKGCTPLHVTAKRNQIQQAELLILYGADPDIPDAFGKNAIIVARESGNGELGDRLLETETEALDKLSNFLLGKKLERTADDQLIVPEIPDLPQRSSKLQKLPNHVFEEIVMDVYDEIDRRELEQLFQKTSDKANFLSLPHLPANPCLSVSRNQARQKLARLTEKELGALIHHILKDAIRRQGQNQEENDYDSVASDDESSLSADISQSDSTIAGLQTQVTSLKKLVLQLSSENDELKNKLLQTSPQNNNLPNTSMDSMQELMGLLPQAKISNSYTKLMETPYTSSNKLDRTKRPQRPTSLIDFKPNNFERMALPERGSVRSCSQFENVERCTKNITYRIQDLVKSIQGITGDDPISHIGCIKLAVNNLTFSLPPGFCTAATNELSEGVQQLQKEVVLFQETPPEKVLEKNEIIRQIRSSAYNIAKATKLVISTYESKFA